MANSRHKADEAAWRDHLVHVVNLYTGRQYGDWYYENYRQDLNRIYERWLQESKLTVRAGKSISDLAVERALIEDQKAQWTQLVKVKNDPVRFLKQSLNYTGLQSFFSDDLLTNMAKRLIQAKSGLQDVDGFFDMLTYLDKRSKFLWAKPLYATGVQTWIDPLIRIWHRRGVWRKDLTNWRPKSHNRERQFASLIRHLLADYDVPAFMDSVWHRNDAGSSRMRDVWVHVASGKNVRKAKRLPMALSKKAAHNLLSAPEELSFEHAFKWAHLQGFELRPRTCAALLGSRWGEDFAEGEFWDSVLRFFAGNPMISPDQVGPIIDYIYAQRFEGPVLLIEGAEILRDDPPHPGFSMRNRQGGPLLEQVAAWHRELARATGRRGKRAKAMDAVYCKSGWKSVQETEKLNDTESAIWEFAEILTQQGLHEEGKAMRHCIYSFHPRVKSGMCSVWSLRTRRKGGPHEGKIKRQLTIEVSSNGRINEARGYANKLPEGRRQAVLRRWAEYNRMSIAPYVFG